MKFSFPTFAFVLFMSAMAPDFSWAQSITTQDSLILEGEVKTRLVLKSADVDRLPKTSVVQEDHGGKKHTYTGVELGLVLKQAGATLAEELRGKNLSKYLMVTASDGYQVLLALAEADPAFNSRKIILANRKDGALLTIGEGPFHLVIEGEKRKARSARQVIFIKVASAK